MESAVVNVLTESLKFTVTLALFAHVNAEQFGSQQHKAQKALQVYQNTLAVYAVNFYLQCMGFETDLEQSDSWNPVMQTLMNVAALEVRDCGRLECRPVPADSQVCQVPAEVWSDRIGYVAVQLNESFTEATLLGFVEKVETGELPLSQLRTLEDLPRFLRNTKQILASVNLGKWFEGVFENGWQPTKALLGRKAADAEFNVRSTNLFREDESERSRTNISGIKQIDLGIQFSDRRLSLVVTVTTIADVEEREILVEIYPTRGEVFLPKDLQMIVLDEAGVSCLEAQARDMDSWMQLEFSGEPGERFSVKLALGDVSMTEYFVI